MAIVEGCIGQLGRRNLEPVDRIAVAKKYEGYIRERAKRNQGERTDIMTNWSKGELKPIQTRSEIAKLADVGKVQFLGMIRLHPLKGRYMKIHKLRLVLYRQEN